jgi:hypothetical protein
MTVSSLTPSIPVPRASVSVAPPPGAAGKSSTAPPALSDATILTCSTPAQLMSKMRQLAVTDPEEFKLLAAEMGARFQTAASASTGQDALLFAKVSAQFQQAAQSGALEPSASSSTPDGPGGTTPITATAAPSGTRQSAYPGPSGLAYSRESGAITRTSWQSPAVDRTFADALDVFTAARGEETTGGATKQR